MLWGAVLAAMVAVSFYPALLAGFVWDDAIFIEAPAVRAWSGLLDIWFSPGDIERERHYWPITYTTFWLEHKLWGLEPFGYHVVNVLLYMVSVLLLWRLLRHLAVPGAWAVAAVFAVHPMHVESVAWVMGRKDLLYGLFYIAAVLCWIRSIGGLGDRRGRSSDSIQIVSRGSYVAALGLFTAAMLSKSAAVTLPLAFVILLWWKDGRLTWTDAWRIAPFFLVALVIAVGDLAYYRASREFSFDYGLVERVLIAGRGLWFYAGKLVWPTDLAVIYPLWDIEIGDLVGWGYLFAAIVVAALLWAGRHRIGRGPVSGALFFAVTLSPVLGFVDYGFMDHSLVAERYAYLAGIGVISVLIGATAYGVSELPRVFRIGASGLLVALLAVFGTLTWEQARVYRDEITYFGHIVSLNPGAHSAHRGLARAFLNAERPVEALAASSAGVERSPGDTRAHNTHGVALLSVYLLDDAAGSFERAMELDPGNVEARHNLAETRRQQGRFEESIELYREVVDTDPEFVQAHVGMGEALFRLGRYDNAIEMYRSALALDSGSARAHAGIGNAWFQMKRYDKAVASLAGAISLEPASRAAADRHVVMGRAFQNLGRTDLVAEHYERALDVDPGNAKALDSLAVLRFRQQRYEDSLRLYETLIEIGEADAQVHANVGALRYRLGRHDAALRSLDRALSMDPAFAGTRFEEMRDALREGRQ